MFIYVKRDKVQIYHQSKIEMSDIEEHIYLKKGLEFLLKETKKDIELYQSLELKTREDNVLLKEFIAKKEKIEKMLETFKIENEMDWK
ncbi:MULTISPECIES: hypothetical protein [Gracilibacillus]|uniref:Uncharacterized protein n=1 Tax=Gracilibacillus dipsosauri TaxID=178340 RepID=A0A317KVX5_9BACI|nr:hypothetical protein [Gracilibacillus dipsosauri]PWU67334.1 hypothetical protein DLJ74_16095 [Gracilibacillus dipsosauri]